MRMARRFSRSVLLPTMAKCNGCTAFEPRALVRASHLLLVLRILAHDLYPVVKIVETARVSDIVDGQTAVRTVQVFIEHGPGE
jgi:hypothetical protein